MSRRTFAIDAGKTFLGAFVAFLAFATAFEGGLSLAGLASAIGRALLVAICTSFIVRRRAGGRSITAATWALAVVVVAAFAIGQLV